MRTSAGVIGKVVEGQIITQLVRLLLQDNTLVLVPNEEITERDVEPPVIPRPEERRTYERKEKGPPKLLRDAMGAENQAAAAPVVGATGPVAGQEGPAAVEVPLEAAHAEGPDDGEAESGDEFEADAAEETPKETVRQDRPGQSPQRRPGGAPAAPGQGDRRNGDRRPPEGTRPEGGQRRRRRRRRRGRGGGGGGSDGRPAGGPPPPAPPQG